MNDDTLLNKVKAGLGITGTYQDTTLQVWIDEVKNFLLDGGIKKSIVESEKCYGIITIGVKDLWNYGSGDGSLSPYFIQRATQLSYCDEPVEEEDSNE